MGRQTRRGSGGTDGRRHVGLTLPRTVKQQALAAASALGWSVGDWILAAAAEHGAALRGALEGAVEVHRRSRVEDASFAALYLTDDERDELDEQAVACGLNRSAFVTSVARLALGASMEEVVAPLVGLTPDDATERQEA